MHDNQYYISGNKAMHGGWSNLSSLQPAYGPSTDKVGSREIGTQCEYDEKKQFTGHSDSTTKAKKKTQTAKMVSGRVVQYPWLCDSHKGTKVQREKDPQKQNFIPSNAFNSTNSHEKLHMYKDSLMNYSEDGTVSTRFVGHCDPRRARKNHQLEKTFRQVLNMLPKVHDTKLSSRNANSNGIGLSSTIPKQDEKYRKHDKSMEQKSAVGLNTNTQCTMSNKHTTRLIPECVCDTTDVKNNSAKPNSDPKYDKSFKQNIETNEKKRYKKSHEKCDPQRSLKQGGVSFDGCLLSQYVDKNNLLEIKSSTNYSNEADKLNSSSKKSTKGQKYERKHNVPLDVSSVVVQPSLSKADQENIWNNNAVVVLETLSSELKKQYNVEILSKTQSETHEIRRHVGSQQLISTKNKTREDIEKENEKSSFTNVQVPSLTSNLASNKGKQDYTKVKERECFTRKSNVEKRSKTETKTELGRQSNLEKHSQTDPRIVLVKQSNVEKHSKISHKTEPNIELGRQSNVEKQSKSSSQCEQHNELEGQSNVKNPSETSSKMELNIDIRRHKISKGTEKMPQYRNPPNNEIQHEEGESKKSFKNNLQKHSKVRNRSPSLVEKNSCIERKIPGNKEIQVTQQNRDYPRSVSESSNGCTAGKMISKNDQIITVYTKVAAKESNGLDTSRMNSNIEKSNCKNQSNTVNQTPKTDEHAYKHENTHKEKNTRKDIQHNQKSIKAGTHDGKKNSETKKKDRPTEKNDSGNKKSDRENFLSSIAKQLDNTKKCLSDDNTLIVDPKVISMSQTLQKASSTNAEGSSIAFTEVYVKGLAKNADLKKGQLFNLDKLRSSLRGTQLGQASNSTRKKDVFPPQGKTLQSQEDKELRYENKKRLELKGRSSSRYTPIPERYKQSFERKFSRSHSKEDKRASSSDSFSEKWNKDFLEPVGLKSGLNMKYKRKGADDHKIRGRQKTSETVKVENGNIGNKLMKQELPRKVDLRNCGAGVKCVKNEENNKLYRVDKDIKDSSGTNKSKSLTMPNHLSCKSVTRKREGKIIRDILVDAKKRSQHVIVSRWEKKSRDTADYSGTRSKSSNNVVENIHNSESNKIEEKRPTTVNVVQVKEMSLECVEDVAILERNETKITECCIALRDVEIMESIPSDIGEAKTSTKSISNNVDETTVSQSEAILCNDHQSNKNCAANEHNSSHLKSNNCCIKEDQKSISKTCMLSGHALGKKKQKQVELLLTNDSNKCSSKDELLKKSVESIPRENQVLDQSNEDWLSCQLFSKEDHLSDQNDDNIPNKDQTCVKSISHEDKSSVNKSGYSKNDQLLNNKSDDSKENELLDDNSDDHKTDQLLNNKSKEDELLDDNFYNTKEDQLLDVKSVESKENQIKTNTHDGEFLDEKYDDSKQDQLLDDKTNDTKRVEVSNDELDDKADETKGDEVLDDNTYEDQFLNNKTDDTEEDKVLDDDSFQDELLNDKSEDVIVVSNDSTEGSSIQQMFDQNSHTHDSSAQSSVANVTHMDQSSINYGKLENNKETDESFQLHVEEITSVSEVEIETSVVDNLNQLDYIQISDPPLLQDTRESMRNLETEASEIVSCTGNLFPEAPLSEKILTNITPLPNMSHQFLSNKNIGKKLDAMCCSIAEQSNYSQEQISTDCRNIDSLTSPNKDENKICNNTVDYNTADKNNSCTPARTRLPNSDKVKEINCLSDTQIQRPKDLQQLLPFNTVKNLSAETTKEKRNDIYSSICEDIVNDKTTHKDEEVTSLLNLSFKIVQERTLNDNIDLLDILKNKSPLTQSRIAGSVEYLDRKKEEGSEIEAKAIESTPLSIPDPGITKAESDKETIILSDSCDDFTIEEPEEVIVPTVPMKVLPKADPKTSLNESSMTIVQVHDNKRSSIPRGELNQGSNSPEVIIISDSEENENEASVSKVTEIGDFIITPASVCVESSTTELVNTEPEIMVVNNQPVSERTKSPPLLILDDRNILRHSYMDSNWCENKTYQRSAVMKTESKRDTDPISAIHKVIQSKGRELQNVKLYNGPRKNTTKRLRKKIYFGMKLPIKKPVGSSKFHSSLNLETGEREKSSSKHQSTDIQRRSSSGNESYKSVEAVQYIGSTKDMDNVLSNVPEQEATSVKDTMLENGIHYQNTKNEEVPNFEFSSANQLENLCSSKDEKQNSEMSQIKKSGNILKMPGKGSEYVHHTLGEKRGNIQEEETEEHGEVEITLIQKRENDQNSLIDESSSVLIAPEEEIGNALTTSLEQNQISLSSPHLNDYEQTLVESQSLSNTSRPNASLENTVYERLDCIQVSKTKESINTDQQKVSDKENPYLADHGRKSEKEKVDCSAIIADQDEVCVVSSITEKENEEQPSADDYTKFDGNHDNHEDRYEETTLLIEDTDCDDQMESAHEKQMKIYEPLVSTTGAESHQNQMGEVLAVESQDSVLPSTCEQVEEVASEESSNVMESPVLDKSNAKTSLNNNERDIVEGVDKWEKPGIDIDVVSENEVVVESQEISNIVEILDSAPEHQSGEDPVVNKNVSTCIKVSIPFENLIKPSVITDKNTELIQEASQVFDSLGCQGDLDDDVQSDETLIYSCDETDQECDPPRVQKKKKVKMSKVVSKLRKVLCENKTIVSRDTENSKRVSIRKRRRCEVLNTITDKISSTSDSEHEPDKVEIMTTHKTKKIRNMTPSRKTDKEEEVKASGDKGKTKTATRKKNGRKATSKSAIDSDLDDLPVIQPPKRCRLQKLSSAGQTMQETMISSNLSSDRIRLELPLHNWLEHKYLNQTVQKTKVTSTEDSSGSQDKESDSTTEKQKHSQSTDEEKCTDDVKVTAESKPVDEKGVESNEDHSEQSVVYSECEENNFHIDDVDDAVDVSASLEDVEMFKDDDVTNTFTPLRPIEDKENGDLPKPEEESVTFENVSPIKNLKELANAVVVSLQNMKENVAKNSENDGFNMVDEKMNNEKPAEMVQPVDLCVKKPKELLDNVNHQKPKPKIQLVHPQKVTCAAPKITLLVQDQFPYVTASTTCDAVGSKVDSVNSSGESSSSVMPLELTMYQRTMSSNDQSAITSTHLSPCNLTCQLDQNTSADTENCISDMMNPTTAVQGKCSKTETITNTDMPSNTGSDMCDVSELDKAFQQQIQELKNLEMLARKKEQEYAQVLAMSRKTIENIMKMKQANKNGDKVAIDPPSATETLSSENTLKSELYDPLPTVVTSVSSVDSVLPLTTNVQHLSEQNISSPVTSVNTSMTTTGLNSSMTETPHLCAVVSNKEPTEASMMTVIDLSKTSSLNRKGMVVQINQALHQAAFESKIKLGKNDTHSAHIQQAHQKKTTSVLDIESPVLPSDASAVCPFRPRMSALTESPTGPSNTSVFDSPQEAHCQPPFQPAGSLIVPALDLDEANKQKQRDYPLPVYNYSGINRAANPSHRALPPKILPDRMLSNTNLGKRSQPMGNSTEIHETLERKRKAMKRDSIVDLTKESALKSGSVLLENILVQNNEKVIQEELTSAVAKRQRIDVITDPFDDSVIAKQKEESKKIPRLQNMGIQNISRSTIPSNISQSAYIPKQFPSNSPVTIEVSKPPQLLERSHSSPSQGFKSPSYSPRTSVYSADSTKVQTYPIRPVPAVALQQVPVKFHQQMSPGNQMVPVGLSGLSAQEKFMAGQSVPNQISQLEPGQIIRDQNYQAWTAHPHLIPSHALAQQVHPHQGMIPRSKPPSLIQKLNQQQALSTTVHHNTYQQQLVPQQLPHHPQQVQQQLQQQHTLPIQQLQQHTQHHQQQQIQHHHQQNIQQQQMRLSTGVELTRFQKPPVSQYRPTVAPSGPLITSMMRSPTGTQPVMSVQNVMQRPVQPLQGLPSHMCIVCGNPSMFLCSGCRNVWYCNNQCQNKHWAVHSRQCKLPNT